MQLAKYVLFIILCVTWQSARAQSIHPAQQIVANVVSQVQARVRAEAEAIETDPGALIAIAHELVLPHIDIATMARRSLGRHWRGATVEHRRRFTAVFEPEMVATYANLMRGKLSDVIVTVIKATEPDARGNVIVPTAISFPDINLPIPVSYKMKLTSTGWLVVDILIDGVSVVLNNRSTYNGEIARDGLESFIRALETKHQVG